LSRRKPSTDLSFEPCRYEVNAINFVNQLAINSACVRVKSKKTSCRQCIDSCPHQALSVADDGEIALDAVRCDKCGRCVVVCPVLAIEGLLPQRSAVDSVLYADEALAPTEKELLLYYRQGFSAIVLEDENSIWR
jgi:Fe-S-cluster-containing hydrogenase component 2